MKLKNILLFSFACLCLASFDANAADDIKCQHEKSSFCKFFKDNKTKLIACGCAVVSGVTGGVTSYLYAKSNPKIAMVASMLFTVCAVKHDIHKDNIFERLLTSPVLGGLTMKNLSDSRALSTIFGTCLSGFLGYSLCMEKSYDNSFMMNFYTTLFSLNLVGLLKYLKDPISN